MLVRFSYAVLSMGASMTGANPHHARTPDLSDIIQDDPQMEEHVMLQRSRADIEKLMDSGEADLHRHRGAVVHQQEKLIDSGDADMHAHRGAVVHQQQELAPQVEQVSRGVYRLPNGEQTGFRDWLAKDVVQLWFDLNNVDLAALYMQKVGDDYQVKEHGFFSGPDRYREKRADVMTRFYMDGAEDGQPCTVYVMRALDPRQDRDLAEQPADVEGVLKYGHVAVEIHGHIYGFLPRGEFTQNSHTRGKIRDETALWPELELVQHELTSLRYRDVISGKLLAVLQHDQHGNQLKWKARLPKVGDSPLAYQGLPPDYPRNKAGPYNCLSYVTEVGQVHIPCEDTVSDTWLRNQDYFEREQ